METINVSLKLKYRNLNKKYITNYFFKIIYDSRLHQNIYVTNTYREEKRQREYSDVTLLKYKQTSVPKTANQNHAILEHVGDTLRRHANGWRLVPLQIIVVTSCQTRFKRAFYYQELKFQVLKKIRMQ